MVCKAGAGDFFARSWLPVRFHQEEAPEEPEPWRREKGYFLLIFCPGQYTPFLPPPPLESFFILEVAVAACFQLTLFPKNFQNQLCQVSQKFGTKPMGSLSSEAWVLTFWIPFPSF